MRVFFTKIILLLFFVPALVLAQNTKIGGFANVDFFAHDAHQSGWAMGQFDNFITSDINDRINFLSEVVFEYNQGFILDVERVIIKYEVLNWFEIKTGKYHTPLGYWNNAYHHGSLLQPTISRPLAVKFEDEGGILPIHSVGLWASGRSIGSWGFGYDVAIDNGLGSHSYLMDENGHKSITAAIHIKPIKKFEVGISSYFDKLFKGEIMEHGDTLGGNVGIIQGAFHLAYLGKKVETISEFHYIHHRIDTIGGSYSSPTNAAYFYLGYKASSKITPYTVFDWISYGANNTYFKNISTHKYSLGLRYTTSALSNIKLEMSRQEFAAGQAVHEVKLSFGIGF